MSKQVWGTFSVKDHTEPNAFVAEVMLYDRLVIPVPPANDVAEWERWTKNGWQPDRLQMLLQILGDRVIQVPWDTWRQANWRNRYEGGLQVAQETTGRWAFQATRSVLLDGLPRHVTGIQAVTNYTSAELLNQELGLKAIEQDHIPMYGGEAVAVLGHEFFVPNDPRWSHEDLLKQAVELSSEPAFKRKRAGFWRWQREFMDSNGITDQAALTDAVQEMHELLEEEQDLARRQDIKTVVQFAFLVSSVGLGMLGGPMTAVAVGGAFVSVGQFVTDKLLESPANDSDKPAALLRDVRKHFGWRD